MEALRQKEQVETASASEARALLSALAGSMGLLLYARRRLGGVTGDVFGCTVECTEWLVLLTFCTL